MASAFVLECLKGEFAIARALIFLVLLLYLAAMGKPSEPERMPMACEVLEHIDIASSLEPGAKLDLNVMHDNDSVRLSLCMAQVSTGSPSISLLLRDIPGDAQLGAASARSAYREELKAEMALNQDDIEEMQIGEAALWIQEAGQLTVWTRGGSVMMIFYVRPSSARPFAEDIAGKVVEAYP